MPASADDPQLDRAIAAALQQQGETGEKGDKSLLQSFPAEVVMHGRSLPHICSCSSDQRHRVIYVAFRLRHPA